MQKKASRSFLRKHSGKKGRFFTGAILSVSAVVFLLFIAHINRVTLARNKSDD
jgi:hypothetical protein